MTSTDEIEIVEEIAPPPPAGVPGKFRERLALALKTTDSTALDQAERDYCGIYPSAHQYVLLQMAGHLPPGFDRLPAVCDPDEIRQAYEAHVGRVVWAIPLGDDRVMIFESIRGTAH